MATLCWFWCCHYMTSSTRLDKTRFYRKWLLLWSKSAVAEHAEASVHDFFIDMCVASHDHFSPRWCCTRLTPPVLAPAALWQIFHMAQSIWWLFKTILFFPSLELKDAFEQLCSVNQIIPRSTSCLMFIYRVYKAVVVSLCFRQGCIKL